MKPADIAERMEYDAMFDRRRIERIKARQQDHIANLREALAYWSGRPWEQALEAFNDWQDEREQETAQERM